MPRKTVTNWGNFPSIESNVSETADVSRINALIGSSDGMIARGNGRCYGDASLGENIFSTLKLNKFLSFDRDAGTLECESGVLLSEILDVVVPAGFFLPVTPGTKFITLGGAIAADVHGKNHHCDGSFAVHVVFLDLLTDSGNVLRCSPTENTKSFWETCGGMGLTGIILRAKFKLRRIETAYIKQASIKATDLDTVMELFEESRNSTYSVAWLDCFAGKAHLGRSILQLGEHARIGELYQKQRKKPLEIVRKNSLSVPFNLPRPSLNYLTVKAFNSLYYNRRWNETTKGICHFDKYFYPLDAVQNWNRIYGRAGFVQYQFVLPLANSYDGMVEILEMIRRSGQGSPLAVLKLFGKPNANAVMSFPLEGYTLALDFKVNPSVFRLLNELDEIVLKHQGRIYLAKDARMSSDVFHQSYERHVTSGHFRSAQSARLKY